MEAKDHRLTNRQSLDMMTQDIDIPVIPPTRLKLESTGDRTSWLQNMQLDEEYEKIRRLVDVGLLCRDQMEYIMPAPKVKRVLGIAENDKEETTNE